MIEKFLYTHGTAVKRSWLDQMSIIDAVESFAKAG